MINLEVVDIRHDRSGFEFVNKLYSKLEEFFLETIEINFESVEWLDADMCAVLGAVFHKISDNLNTVRIRNIKRDVACILSKNGFLSHYGGERLLDTHQTTIQYRRFNVNDDHYFATYLDNELLHRPEIPRMSPRLVKKFTESVFELFSNAVIHSDTKLGIFSCGQFYPTRHTLDFTVVDLGVGIPHKVNSHRSEVLSDVDAIQWATAERNTTRSGPIPGGLGLKLLQDFIRLNRGRIQIVSERGYWCFSNSGVTSCELECRFPGTAVNLEINTADKNTYVLSSELSARDIF